MSKSFRLGGLSTVYHSPETKAIFNREIHNGQSQASFVAEKIVSLARAKGFDNSHYDYIDEKRRQEIVAFSQKSRTVDYTYLYAFEYLRHVMEHVSKSTIIRLAIVS